MSTLAIVLVVILLLAAFGSFPVFGYNANWGYGPSGALGLIVVVLLILLLMGRI